jgi:hypothetical protein
MSVPLYGSAPQAPANLKPAGYAQLTSLAAAVDCPVPGRIVDLMPETQGVRIRHDGTDPTTTVGFLIPAGTCYRYEGDPSKLRIIEAAASATLNVLGYD